jgi:hypothetical protein
MAMLAGQQKQELSRESELCLRRRHTAFETQIGPTHALAQLNPVADRD